MGYYPPNPASSGSHMTGLCGPACHSSSPMEPHREPVSHSDLIFFFLANSLPTYNWNTLISFLHTHIYARNIVKNKPAYLELNSLHLCSSFSLSQSRSCQLELISMTKEASCSHRSLTPGSGSSEREQENTAITIWTVWQTTTHSALGLSTHVTEIDSYCGGSIVWWY